MKFFDNIIKIQIQQSIIDMARQFAVEVVETINYSDSNQFSKQKIEDDHFISKLGEEAVKVVFSKFATVKGPDYRIYDAKSKSWDADLYINDVGLAVKTQKRTAAIRYGLSWTFQAGNFRSDKILNKPEAWVSFVEYDDVNAGNFCHVYPAFQIKELKFRDPFLEKLKVHKRVVYASDIKVN